jgi:putative hemolysin
MATTGFWLLLAIFAGASLFFALAESSLFSIGRFQALQLARTPGTGERVARLLDAPQDLLATIVLGNTLANAGLVALSVGWMPWSGWRMALALVAVFVLILFGCEVIPKTLAVRQPERWAMLVARPMLALIRISRPIRSIAQRLNVALLRVAVPGSVQPLTAVSEEEYRELVEMAGQQGALGASEREIILQILSLDRRTARDVMRPRSQMRGIPDDLSVPEMILEARRLRHRRLPMYDETPDTIVGVLNTRTLLLNPEVDLSEAIEFPSFVPETMNLLQLLQSLQRQQRGMAIVLDEFGGTAGMVTIEDILEEMVGRVRGEGEADGFVMERLGEGRWRVSAAMRLDDFRREYPALPEPAGVETMGGLFLHQAGIVPAVGETVLCAGLRLTAQAGDERRLRELGVEVVKKRGGVA